MAINNEAVYILADDFWGIDNIEAPLSARFSW